MAHKNNILLKVKDLSVSYGMVKALKEVSIELAAGEFIALVGANGSGKSTMLETLIGFHKPDQGSIYFNGEDITSLPTYTVVTKGMALCPEGRGVLPQMSVYDNILLGAYHNRSNIKKSMELALSLFPILSDRMQQMAGTLSGGQQQMLSIARALMANPKLLILDEPSLGLAPLLVNDILETVKKLSTEGYSILLSEQNVKKSLDYASRAYVFDTGKIVLSGSAEELKKNPAVVDAYLGEKQC